MGFHHNTWAWENSVLGEICGYPLPGSSHSFDRRKLRPGERDIPDQTLNQRNSSRAVILKLELEGKVDFAPRGQLAMSGDTVGCHDWGYLVGRG